MTPGGVVHVDVYIYVLVLCRPLCLPRGCSVMFCLVRVLGGLVS